MPDSEGGKLALILWRLDQIESQTTQTARWHRQIMAGVIVALSLPVVQMIVSGIQMAEGK